MANVAKQYTEIIEKYTPEILHGIDGRVVYKDAWLEAGKIIIPTREIADSLDGWAAYEFAIDKKGKASPAKDAIIGEPSVYEFTQWAKQQDVDDLRHLLKQNGVQAKGNVAYILAYRLAYLYEAKQLARQGREIPNDSARVRHIKALDTLLNVKGVSNEQAIVMVRNAITTGIMPKPGKDTMSGDEKIDPKKIRERLKQADTKAREEGDTPQDEKPASSSKKGSESEAIKSGKGKKAEQTEKAPTTKKDDVKPAAKAAESTTDKETEEMSTKKTTAKKTTKSAAKPAAKAKAAEKKSEGREPKGGLVDAKKDIPIGSTVKYLGTRNKHLKGKSGVVLRYVGPNGVAVKYSDGTVGSVSPTQLEMVKKGTGKVA